MVAKKKSIRARGRQWAADAMAQTYPRPELQLDPQRAALLVIDMQRYFCDPEGRSFLEDSSAILDHVARLIEAARKAGAPVIFTRHGHAADGSDLGMLGRFWVDAITRAEPDWEIVDACAPEAGDLVIDKTRYDAFFGTDLEKKLRSRKRDQVIVTGVMTHLCCETTARSAFVRDFEVYVAADATASSSLKLHQSALRSLAHGFAIVLTTDEIIQAMGR